MSELNKISSPHQTREKAKTRERTNRREPKEQAQSYTKTDRTT